MGFDNNTFCWSVPRRGTLALQKLCTLLGAERVYRELATILEGEADLEFATIMVQVSFLGKLGWSLPLKILDWM
jgi:hypothetical protein